MAIEDSRRNEIGSDRNLLWYKVRSRSMEEIVKRIKLKWRVDGRQD